MVQSQQMHRKYLLLAYNADTIAAIQEAKNCITSLSSLLHKTLCICA